MKIGIMTFHWAANHGAILQAYALQKYLQSASKDSDVQIIDYYPTRYKKSIVKAVKCRHINIIKNNLIEYYKEKKLRHFRSRLKKTKYFPTEKSLLEGINDFDILICGSDQVWNDFFTTKGENRNKPSFAYYLSFGGNAKRISYAASFGYTTPKEDINKLIKPYLQKFDAISVRENTGVNIIQSMGLEAQVVCDPTLLLAKKEYAEIASYSKNRDFVAYYFLRWTDKQKKSKIKIAKKSLKTSNFIDIEKDSMERWLGNICNSDFVITNSFHCVVFSLIFHKKFIFIGEIDGLAGMNDRINTLLKLVGLEDRIMYDFNYTEDTIDKVVNSEINWEYIDKKLREKTDYSKDFLLKYCKMENKSED